MKTITWKAKTGEIPHNWTSASSFSFSPRQKSWHRGVFPLTLLSLPSIYGANIQRHIHNKKYADYNIKYKDWPCKTGSFCITCIHFCIKMHIRKTSLRRLLIESYRISKTRQNQPINKGVHNRLEMHKYRIFQKLSSPAQRSMAQCVKQKSAVLSTQL